MPAQPVNEVKLYFHHSMHAYGNDDKCHEGLLFLVLYEMERPISGFGCLYSHRRTGCSGRELKTTVWNLTLHLCPLVVLYSSLLNRLF